MKSIDLELHDGVLRSLHADYSKALVTLFVDAYLSVDTKVRSPVEINFVDVENMSCIADFESMATNSRAGNINYWAPAANGGSTYVYLSEGCIVIRAAEVRVSLVGGT